MHSCKKNGPDSELMKEAEDLFEKLTRISDNDEIKAHSFDRLSKISFLRRDYDKALYYNGKIMPPNGLYPRSEYAKIKLCIQDDNHALNISKETLFRNIYEYSNTLYWILRYYHQHDMLTEAIDEVERGIKLFELFDFCGYFFQDLSIYYEYSAYIHALQKEFDKVIDDIESAYEYALKCDTIEVSKNYKLFGDIIDENNITHEERKDLLATLLSQSRSVYEPIKETQRYKNIIKKLEKS